MKNYCYFLNWDELTKMDSHSIEEKLRVTERVKLSHRRIFLSTNLFSRSLRFSSLNFPRFISLSKYANESRDYDQVSIVI